MRFREKSEQTKCKHLDRGKTARREGGRRASIAVVESSFFPEGFPLVIPRKLSFGRIYNKKNIVYFPFYIYFEIYSFCVEVRGGKPIRDKEQIKSDKKSAFPFPLAVFPLALPFSLSTLILCRFFRLWGRRDAILNFNFKLVH